MAARAEEIRRTRLSKLQGVPLHLGVNGQLRARECQALNTRLCRHSAE